jgi:hypothetical protein
VQSGGGADHLFPTLNNKEKGIARSRQAYLLAVALIVGMLLAFTGVAWAATALSNTSDPVPQTNGRVNAIALSGDTVYIGGSFTSVGGEPRSRLAAIDADTGRVTNWAPHVSRPVSALAVSGNTVYAGGAFNKAGGKVHNYVAAIEASGTGQVIHAFDAGADAPVRALAASGGVLYLGGDFGTVNGQARSRLAQVDANGDLTSWAPAANGPVRALELSGSRLYVGGEFSTISGQIRRNLAALNASTGAVVNWRPQFSRPVYDVEASGTSVYVAGGGAGGEGVAFRVSDARLLWSTQVWDGDFQAVAYLDGQVYFGGHFRELPDGTRRVRLLAVAADTGALSAWKAEANRGVWALEADVLNTQIYAGGDFTKITGRTQEGFAQFS